MPLLPFSSSPPVNFSSDTLHVKKAGDNMTGTLDMGMNPIIMQASDGTRWAVSVNIDGSLNTQLLVAGSPMGLLLALTYP